MRHLITDIVRRTYRWPSAFFLFGIAVFWAGRVGRGGVQTAFAVSLASAFLIGPLFVAGTPQPRVIHYLPISRRDLWRATWLVATVVPVLLTTTAKLLAQLVLRTGSSPGFSSLALSSVYDFAYTGIGCGLIVLAALSARSVPAPGLRRHVFWVIFVVRTVAFVGAPLWIFAIRHWLPTQWADLTPVSGTILTAALALSLATYFHTPVPIAGERGAPRLRPKTARSRAGRFSGLTGLPRLLMHEYAWSTGLAAFLVVIFGAMVFAAGVFMNSPNPYDGFLRMQSLLLFDNALERQRGQLFDLLIWCGLFSAANVSRFPEIIRHLRVLPLRASQLNALLVAWPLLMLLTVWVGLVGLHYAVLGKPVESLQPALFVGLGGSSAVMRALSLRWPRYSPVIFSLTACVVPMVRLLNGSSSLLALLGFGGLAAAAALNHFTLMRGSTYKRPAQGLGVVKVERWA